MSAESITVEHRREPWRWLRPVIVGFAGLFYAYAVWNAVAYLVAMTQLLTLTPYQWFVLLFAVAFPALAFAAAWLLGKRRTVAESAVVMLAGLGLVAVFWMNVVAYSALTFPTLPS